MIKKIKNKLRKPLIKSYRRKTHGQVIEEILNKEGHQFQEKPVFIEIGYGESTYTMAQMAQKYQAYAYSLDIDSSKTELLRSKSEAVKNHIDFKIGDSLDTLQEIIDKHDRIDFVFFDSAASAMQTFKEFCLVENYLSENACILIDNAAIPDKRQIHITAVRKGKILAPYLLASDHWEVHSHARDGDSMISAFYHSEGGYADLSYERK